MYWLLDEWDKPIFYDKKIFLSGCHGKEMILKLCNEEENVYKYQITKKEERKKEIAGGLQVKKPYV